MMAFAYYLLKLVICSGILFCYYQLFLKNRVFHQWNRFYLLATVLLSVLLPFIQLNVWPANEQTVSEVNIVLLAQSADEYLENITIGASAALSPEQWLLIVYAAISLILAILFFWSLLRLRSLVKANTVQQLAGVKFVITAEPSAPFSFLRYVFWNKNISLQTATGQQIFQHELVHVRENHTLDKLFMQVMLLAFWCNPFFWLIRRELRLVHEFIADKKSVGEHGTEAFASMLLQAAFPQQFNTITNQFFQTSIKRRLAMLTKIKNPNVAYASRLLALPLIATTVFAFTVRTKALPETVKENSNLVQKSFRTAAITDTVPQKQIGAVNVQKADGNNPSRITISYADGTSETLTEAEARKRGLLRNKEQVAFGHPLNKKAQTAAAASTPLYILDGKEIGKEEMNKLNPNAIQSINVLKDKTATDKYGNKGKNGVVEIKLKDAGSKDGITITENGQPKDQHEVIVTGHPLQKKQDKNADVDDSKVFLQTETPASIDKEIWQSFLTKNTLPLIRNAAAKGAKPGSYIVNMRFLVRKDGSLSNFEALNNPGYDLDKKLLAIMPESPKWKPAEQNGRPVNSYHVQPITFVIQEQ